MGHTHGTLCKTDHILDNKICLNKFERTEIISITFNHNGMKVEISNKSKIRKKNTWKLKNALLIIN